MPEKIKEFATLLGVDMTNLNIIGILNACIQKVKELQASIPVKEEE